jgi:hypothetical protein
VGVENWRACTTELNMPRTEMLVAMNTYRPSFGNARADPVCAFDLLRPYTSGPDSPVFELLDLRFITAMVNGYAISVAKQNDISLLADDRVKTIDLFLSLDNNTLQGLAISADFALGDYVGRSAAIRIDTMLSCASSPGT